MSSEREETREEGSPSRRSENKRKSPCYKFFSYEFQYVKKYFSSASIDGIDHVTEGKSIVRRIVWALILLISLCACVYFLYEHGKDFADKPTSTTLNIVRPKEGIPFPAVTVCNLNPVSKSYAEEYNVSSFLTFFLTASEFFEQNVSDCEAIVEGAGLADSTLTFDEIFRSGASPRKDFIRNCVFSLNGTTTRNCDDFLTSIVTSLGLCHTFNSITSNQSDSFFQVGGSKYGLRMYLNISQNDYIASFDDDAGIIVSVHDRHTFPNPFEKGISVAPGRHAKIGITAKRTVDKTNKGNCLKGNSLHSLIPDVEYSTSGCRANARYEHISDDNNCNCIEYRTPLLSEELASERNCTLADTCCIAEADYFVESTVECPPPCDFITYDTTVSYSKFPYRAAAEEYSSFNGVDMETIDDDLLSFNVYYSDLYMEHAETIVSYGPRLLVADIGGTLGLFLGASIISFMELVILFYDEIKGVCCSSKKVRKGWSEFELKVMHPRRKKELLEQEQEQEQEETAKEESTKDGDNKKTSSV